MIATLIPVPGNTEEEEAALRRVVVDCQPLTSEGAESSAIPRDPTLPKPGIARFKPVPGTGFSSRLQPTLTATRGALSVCKLEAVLLTATEKEWALNGQSVERQQSENASEIVRTNRGVLAGNNN